MSTQIIYKYNIGDTVQIKTKFDGIASNGLIKNAGKVVTIIACRYYGEPCYKFAELADCGWFTEGSIKGRVNPFVIFAGDSRDELEAIASAPTRRTAIAIAKELQNDYSLVEATYMPEENEDTNTIIYAHYEEVI